MLTTNEIIPSRDEKISLNDNLNFDSSNCDDSLNSISISSNITYYDINENSYIDSDDDIKNRFKFKLHNFRLRFSFVFGHGE